MPSNYSLYSIPAYWFLTLVPHAYAIATVKRANNNFWNNASPRSVDFLAACKKAIPADVYARFERAEAAHANGLENAPLFIGAVLAGNVAGLESSTLNASLGAFLGLRVLYTALYVNTTDLSTSRLRSVTWLVSTLVLFGVYIGAGNKMLAA